MAQYMLKCDVCGFKRWSDGSLESFSDLYEIVLCAKCGGAKSFRCPGCGFVIKAKRWVEPPLPEKNAFVKD